MDQEQNAKNKVLSRFREGKEFTEELLKDNEKLRLANFKLNAKRLELEKACKNSEIETLKAKNELLEKELQAQIEANKALQLQFVDMEEANRNFADRYIEVENHNSDLISLYVASLQLHSTLDYKEIIIVLKDVVINMVGAEKFAIYLKDPQNGKMKPLVIDGYEETRLENIAQGDPQSQSVLETGNLFIQEMAANQKRNQSGEPIACIPLKVNQDVFGVVTIHELLQQKEGFKPLDFELFELLGQHAATAIFSSKMYALGKEKSTDMDKFLQLVNDIPKSPVIEDPLATLSL